MSRVKTLAKILIVSKDAQLDSSFDEYYAPFVNMYVFFSVCEFDPITHHYCGVRKLHDRIIREMQIPDLDPKYMNYVSVDITSNNKHTYLMLNKRGYQLSEKQISYLKDMFDVDS